MGNGKLKAAKTKAEILRTIFAGLNMTIGLATLIIVVYVNFMG